MTLEIGNGIIVFTEGGQPAYRGSLPKDAEKQPVVILRKEDLDLIVRGNIDALLTQKHPMSKEFYEQQSQYSPFFEDRMRFLGVQGNETKLFLDRNLYSPDLSKMVLVRYVSVDQSLREENLA